MKNILLSICLVFASCMSQVSHIPADDKPKGIIETKKPFGVESRPTTKPASFPEPESIPQNQLPEYAQKGIKISCNSDISSIRGEGYSVEFSADGNHYQYNSVDNTVALNKEKPTYNNEQDFGVIGNRSNNILSKNGRLISFAYEDGAYKITVDNIEKWRKAIPRPSSGKEELNCAIDCILGDILVLSENAHVYEIYLGSDEVQICNTLITVVDISSQETIKTYTANAEFDSEGKRIVSEYTVFCGAYNNKLWFYHRMADSKTGKLESLDLETYQTSSEDAPFVDVFAYDGKGLYCYDDKSIIKYSPWAGTRIWSKDLPCTIRVESRFVKNQLRMLVTSKGEAHNISVKTILYYDRLTEDIAYSEEVKNGYRCKFTFWLDGFKVHATYYNEYRYYKWLDSPSYTITSTVYDRSGLNLLYAEKESQILDIKELDGVTYILSDRIKGKQLIAISGAREIWRKETDANRVLIIGQKLYLISSRQITSLDGHVFPYNKDDTNLLLASKKSLDPRIDNPYWFWLDWDEVNVEIPDASDMLLVYTKSGNELYVYFTKALQ